MSQTRLSLGQIVDSEGVDLALEEGDLVAGIVVVMKIVQANTGEVNLGIARSESSDWMEELGLLTAAYHTVKDGFVPRMHDCDDEE